MGVFQDLKRTASTAASAIRNAAQVGRGAIARFIRFEPTERALMISEDLVFEIVRRAAGSGRHVELGVRGAGYSVCVSSEAGALSVFIVPEGLRWHGTQVEIDVLTPEGIRLEEKPIVSWFVATIARLLGGTAVARYVLSGSTPDGLTWDGRRATYRAPLDPRWLPRAVAEAPVVKARLSRADGWLRVECAGAGQYEALERHFARNALDLAVELGSRLIR